MKKAQVAGIGLYIAPNMALGSPIDNGIAKITSRIPLKVVGNSTTLAKDKRIAFGWTPHILNPDDSVLLKPGHLLEGDHLFLRLSVAVEMWEQAILQVTVPDGKGTQLGVLDIRSSSVLVPYELKIDGTHRQKIKTYGIELKLLTPEPFGFFGGSMAKMANTVFVPHLLVSSEEIGTIDDFLNCFMSLNSIQAFGWRRAPYSTAFGNYIP